MRVKGQEGSGVRVRLRVGRVMSESARGERYAPGRPKRTHIAVFLATKYY